MSQVLPIVKHTHQSGGHGEPIIITAAGMGSGSGGGNDIGESDDEENPNMRLVPLTIRLLSATPHKWGPKKIITVQLLL